MKLAATLSVLLALCLSAAPQPPEARRARAAYERAVADAQEKMDAEVASAKADYLRALSAARVEAGRRTRLDEMNALQAEADRVAATPVVGARSKITPADVAGKRFFFMTPQRNDPLLLTPQGRIENSIHHNESFWRVRDGRLEFIDANGSTPTSTYTVLTAKDGQLVLSGHFDVDDQKLPGGGHAPTALVLAGEQ